MREESVTAYEVAYTGTFAGRTTAGVAFYVNDVDDNINFAQLPNTRDPYTAANPPPGWLLGPDVLALMAQRGIFLPRTAYTYLNLGPLRQKGIELSIDHRISRGLSAFANYSWQAKPTVLDDPQPFPSAELALPPTNRVNVGFTYDGPPAARQRHRELLGFGVLERRAVWPLPRLHRRLHDGQWQRRREVGERTDHDAREGDESPGSEDSAARLRRRHHPVGDRGGPFLTAVTVRVMAEEHSGRRGSSRHGRSSR